MAKSIVIDPSEKKYTFSFELTKPQSDHFWKLLIQGCCLSDLVFYGVTYGRLETAALRTAKRWCRLEKEITPLIIAGKLTPIEEETVDNTTD